LRPAFLASEPAEGGIIEMPRGRVRLSFSSPLDRSSLDNLVFKPSISGSWSLEEGGRAAVFSPSVSWTGGREYRLTIKAGVSGDNLMGAGSETNLHFIAGCDNEKPFLICARAVDEAGLPALVLDKNTVNSGWERAWLLELEFSEDVDPVTVRDAVLAEPSLSVELACSPEYGPRHLIRFASEPGWDKEYLLTVNNNVKDRAGNQCEEKEQFRIKTDGPFSKPPVLTALRFPTDNGPLVFTPERICADLPLSADLFPFETPVAMSLELYFDGASPPGLFSLAERFKISAANSALSFSPREIRFDGFEIEEAAEGFEDLIRVEIRGLLTNRPYGGLATVEIGEGLTDRLGNRNPEAARILLLK
jgi:hypothetical protein